MSAFVFPETDQLKLSGGNYLIVKRELTAAEERRVLARSAKPAIAGEKLTIDIEQVGRVKVAEYVVEWGGPGFVDRNGKAVPFSESALDKLRGATFKELLDAIEAHEDAQTALRVAEKNDQGGESSSTPISSSVN